ncbi:uncharacterized protein LOC125739679 isoform X2 [Brienomyrus brachyistius]|nr:uncharacterized protein LOC125739679 isoform X2 [Brienomyrus brachyistius]XP_048865992.1 uncharacterized protein LOC125739679 isoform X2 [Brienomyrus brachyistius]XP_048865993.1 uncharacterized protein LOC125739679 isoform X2 [Brienomyrus brachyistius]XP_048865994.1 uncharacterized protein LOC125739679 isoform X2 [Brienomyrus brachyistius]
MDLLVPGPDERGGRMMFRFLLILCLGHCLPAVLGADSSNDSHVGDTVMLPCDGPAATDTNEVHVMWMFEGRPACEYENGTWCEIGHHVNRTRLGSIRQNNFSLVINPVRKEDDGAYVCRINGKVIRIIRLNVDGDGKPEDAVMPPGGGRKRRDAGTAGEVCRPYREREDPPGSETKDKQDFDENLSGRKREMIGVTVLLMVTMAVALVLFKRNRQRAKKLPDLGPSEDALINGASVHAGESSADKKMEEPAV